MAVSVCSAASRATCITLFGMSVHVIVITGSMGSGKTTVLGEASDLLSAADIPHGLIDLDALGVVGVADVIAAHLQYRHLAAVYSHLVAAGITRVLLAEAIESRTELERIAAAMRGAALVVCRLTASIATMEARLRVREPGILREQFVARAGELDHILARVALEDFTISNDGRPVTDVARELLQRAGWVLAPLAPRLE